MVKQVPHATITFEWDELSKRWKVTYLVRSGKGVAAHWYWVDSRAALDAPLMRDITRAATAVIEAALF